MDRLSIELAFEWKAVRMGEDGEYFFPQPVTKSMRQAYPGPAVYRWNIYKDRPTDRKLVYIGETAKLAPDRIRGYLKPGPSQTTNQRLKREFEGYLEQGLRVRLEVLRPDEVTVGDITLGPDDLQDKHVRQFIEELLITYYTRVGFTVLNL